MPIRYVNSKKSKAYLSRIRMGDEYCSCICDLRTLLLVQNWFSVGMIKGSLQLQKKQYLQKCSKHPILSTFSGRKMEFLEIKHTKLGNKLFNTENLTQITFLKNTRNYNNFTSNAAIL